MCTVWAVIDDDVVLLPLAVAVGSFCMQTHLGYLFLVPILLAFALVVVVLRRRAGGPGRFRDLRAPLRNSLIVGLVLWAQPLWEQFFGGGPGQPRPPAHRRHRRIGSGRGEEHHRPVRRRASVQLGRRSGPVVAAPGIRHVGAEFDVDRGARRARAVGARSARDGRRARGTGALRRGGGARLGGGPAQRTRRHRARVLAPRDVQRRRDGHVDHHADRRARTDAAQDPLSLDHRGVRHVPAGAVAPVRAARRRPPWCRGRARRGGSGRRRRHDPGPHERRRTGVLQRHVRLDRRHPVTGVRLLRPRPSRSDRRSASTPVGSGSPSRTRRR